MNKKIIDVSKTWKFTEYDLSRRQFYENCDCNLIAFGEEACPSTGRKHLQGHVSFKRAYRLTALKKLTNAHWEIAKCDDFNYELKGENVFIKDNRKKKGTRTDLDNIAELANNGVPITEIARKYPSQFIRYGKGIRDYHSLVNKFIEKAEHDNMDCCEWVRLPPCFEEDLSYVILGEAGCGKTQYALSHFDNPKLVSHIDDLLDYDPSVHDGIVIDDMSFAHWHRTAQIHITDWDNTRSIHCRYRTATIPKHTRKIFTGNEYMFKHDPAIDRRVKIMTVTCNLGD